MLDEAVSLREAADHARARLLDLQCKKRRHPNFCHSSDHREFELELGKAQADEDSLQTDEERLAEMLEEMAELNDSLFGLVAILQCMQSMELERRDQVEKAAAVSLHTCSGVKGTRTENNVPHGSRSKLNSGPAKRRVIDHPEGLATPSHSLQNKQAKEEADSRNDERWRELLSRRL